jgi:hypothetical protein
MTPHGGGGVYIYIYIWNLNMWIVSGHRVYTSINPARVPNHHKKQRLTYI